MSPKYRIPYLSLLVCLIPRLVFSQFFPPTQNYAPTDYGGENQNWAITQSDKGEVYFANNHQLLEYNGINWFSYPSPNGSVIRSLLYHGERIYAGCYMEFGYWEKDGYGLLHYTTLADGIRDQILEDEQFWNSVEVEGNILFQSHSRIYSYDTVAETIEIIEAPTKNPKLFVVGNEVYLHDKDSGLYRIARKETILVSESSSLLKNAVVGIFPIENEILLLMQNGVFYRLEGDRVKEARLPFVAFPTNISIYSSMQCSNGIVAVGSISNGLYLLDFTSKKLTNLNRNRGLNNNTVLSLFEDGDRNLWLGLDNGISLINLESPFSEFIDVNGQLGVVYTAIMHQNNLYLGTNQGLFVWQLEGQNEPKMVSGTEGQVWKLRLVDNTLFCAHTNGTFTVEGDKAVKIENTVGTWDVKPIPNTKDFLLQGSYKGLSVLQRKANKTEWQFFSELEGIDFSSRFFEFLPSGSIVVNHEYKGVFVYGLEEDMKAATLIKQQEHFGFGSALVSFNDQVKYTTLEGIFSIDPETFGFYPDSTLTSLLFTENYRPKSIMLNGIHGESIWNFTNTGLLKLYRGSFDGSYFSNHIQLPKKILDGLGVAGFENLNHLYGDTYLFGMTEGYMTLDSERIQKKQVPVYVERAVVTYANGSMVSLDLFEENNIPSDANNLQLFLGMPEYQKYSDPILKYSLNGFDGPWLDMGMETNSIRLNNIKPGNYSLVLATVNNGVEFINQKALRFSIKKPWYVTHVAIIVYLLLGMFLLFSVHKANEAAYNKKQRELVRANEAELERKRIENSERIIALKNEQLQNQVESKNRELAAATMNIIKKNRFLNEIKEQLENGDDKSRRAVIYTINRNLNNQDDWKEFERAFTGTDKNFLKKLKRRHPNLTSNDLRLCTYLRLNLSTKEIAPLLNISVRSVEVKRYRLRKKMDLDQNVNLADHIMSL